jgi:hypothetical protein
VLALHKLVVILLALAACDIVPAIAQPEYPAPEKLGKVSFSVSCSAAVKSSFNHAVALLHSFAYAAAQKEFVAIAGRDPRCAMAHWGIAMSYYHQLWDPPISKLGLEAGKPEIEKAQDLALSASEREQAFIHALAIFYETGSRLAVRNAALAYTNAMRDTANANPDDTESQVFYALSFLAIAPASDPAHTSQKLAAQILEPLFERHPDHPGIAHYLIHAYDHPDLAKLGLTAARAYSRIAPSAPHALHMPSHIFTLLGLWPDSINGNLAARAAAHQQGDIGEELHAMDYLTYAFLQSGRFEDAANLLTDLRNIGGLPTEDFKVAYASTVMPVRYAIERRQWAEASDISADPRAAPQFRAIAEWAKAVAAARSGEVPAAELHAQNLEELLAQVRKTGDAYWTAQVQIQVSEAGGWLAHARGDQQQALNSLREAATQEDALVKRPITPGPVIPAREQLADLLLEVNQPDAALREFEFVLRNSRGRRNALSGMARAKQLSTSGP